MSGYGIILYLNIYCLLISLIAPSSVVFFDGDFLNNLFKLLIIISGGFAMQRSSALIGNLIGAGAGSRELMDASLGRMGAAAAMGGMKLLGKGAWAGGKKLFGGKKDEKGKDDKKEGDSKTDENQNNGNEGEKLDKDPKYGNDKNIGDKMKNGNSEEKKEGGAAPAAGDSGAGEGGREADVNDFKFGKDQANQMTAGQISEALHNGSLGTIAEASEEEEDED